MQIRELLQTPLMRNAKVIAGHNGLDNEVTWCAPDTEIEFNQWIMPGLLLLHTPDYERKPWEETAPKMDKARPSGIVLFPDTFTETMQTVIEQKNYAYFTEKHLPLILLPRGINMLSFSKYFTSVMATHLTNEYHRDEWLRTLTYHGFSGDNTEGISYNYNPRYAYYCLLVTVLSKSTERNYIQEDMELNSVHSFLIPGLSLAAAPVLSFVDSSSLILFIPDDSFTSGVSIQNCITVQLQKLSQIFPSFPFTASVGSAADSLSLFSASYYNAKKTSDVTQALHVSETVSFYDDWYMYTLLLNAPKRELELQSERLLKPILPNHELVETLAAYLEYGENLNLASKKLFIHINTLKYRLQKISSLLGCDLKDPHTRFRLRVAIVIRRYLELGT